VRILHFLAFLRLYPFAIYENEYFRLGKNTINKGNSGKEKSRETFIVFTISKTTLKKRKSLDTEQLVPEKGVRFCGDWI